MLGHTIMSDWIATIISYIQHYYFYDTSKEYQLLYIK